MAERKKIDKVQVMTEQRMEDAKGLGRGLSELARKYGKEGCVYVGVTGIDSRLPSDEPEREWRNFSAMIALARKCPEAGPEAMCKMLAALQLVQLQLAAEVVEHSNMTSEEVVECIQEEVNKMTKAADAQPGVMDYTGLADDPFVLEIDKDGEDTDEQ